MANLLAHVWNKIYFNKDLPKLNVLYKFGAGVFWLFTSLFSLIYLIGGLITSPGMSIISMMDTLDKLKIPTLPIMAISGVSCLAVLAFHLTMIVLLAPIILPISVVMTPAALVIEGSGWIGGAVELALVLFGLSGLMFNNNPDHPSLIFEGRTTSLSIHPAEFLRIINEKFNEKILHHATKDLNTGVINVDVNYDDSPSVKITIEEPDSDIEEENRTNKKI